jgi:hypothetical protein
MTADDTGGGIHPKTFNLKCIKKIFIAFNTQLFSKD